MHKLPSLTPQKVIRILERNLKASRYWQGRIRKIIIMVTTENRNLQLKTGRPKENISLLHLLKTIN